MATKYEVTIKGSAYIKHKNGTKSNIKINQTFITEDLIYAQSLKQKSVAEQWVRNNYAGATPTNVSAIFRSIKDNNKSSKSSNGNSSSGGSWGCFAILKPIWWIFKLIRWIFRLFFK